MTDDDWPVGKGPPEYDEMSPMLEMMRSHQMECDGESQGGKLEAMPGTKGDGARGPSLIDRAEVGAVLSILDGYRGYPRDLDTHDPVIQECRDRLRKLVTTECDHRHSYVERYGRNGDLPGLRVHT